MFFQLHSVMYIGARAMYTPSHTRLWTCSACALLVESNT